jgi:hypothetical protein
MAILDEVAFLRDDNSASPDSELHAAIVPGLSTIPQAQLIGISTPYMKSGLLWKKHKECFGINDDNTMVIVAPSHVMNPSLDLRDRDRQLIEDPDKARSEWWAEFRQGLSAFIDPAIVDRAVVPGRIELQPVPDTTYVAATDPSGGSSDSMTLAVAHAEDKGQRAVLDLVAEWRAPFSPRQVVVKAAAICKRYGVRTVIGDRYGGLWPREQFMLQGVDYDVAAWTRSDAYLTLLPALNTPGKIELLDNPRLLAQLCGLVRHTVRGGRDIVDHARGARDDVINAAALALVSAALAPRSGADHWLEFMRRQVVAQQLDVDRDDVMPPPNFGFQFSTGNYVTLNVPPAIGAEGDISAQCTGGQRFGVRRFGDRITVDLPHEAARELLRRPIWREMNPDKVEGIA